MHTHWTDLPQVPIADSDTSLCCASCQPAALAAVVHLPQAAAVVHLPHAAAVVHLPQAAGTGSLPPALLLPRHEGGTAAQMSRPGLLAAAAAVSEGSLLRPVAAD